MNDRAYLERAGFTGFVTPSALRSSSLAGVPSSPGVYAVLRENTEPPRFLDRSVGGHFKGKDPTVAVAQLQDAWMPGTAILCIGKAGGASIGATLRGRLRQYLDFGAGRPVGHWGGRYIWQLADSAELLFAWCTMGDLEPRQVERSMLADFRQQHGRLPFANLAG